MKKLASVAAFFFAVITHAENPRLGEAGICDGIKRGTPAKVEEILIEMGNNLRGLKDENDPLFERAFQRALNRLDEREILLAKWCGSEARPALQALGKVHWEIVLGTLEPETTLSRLRNDKAFADK